MNNTLAKKKAIDQVPSAVELEKVVGNFENLGDFLNHVEPGVRAFMTEMPRRRPSLERY